MNNIISKKQSIFLYGIAIILMIYHHLYCIPSRLTYEYYSVLNSLIPSFMLETKIAWFSKICVAIFAFLSGYGFSIKFKQYDELTPFKNLFNNYIIVIKKILKLMLKLTIVLVIFVPCYYIFNKREITFLEIIKNIIGYSSSLNGEWWYVKFYFSICIILPILNIIFIKYESKIKFIIFSLVSIIIITLLYTLVNFYYNYISYAVILLEGYLIARFNIFNFIKNKLNHVLNIILSIITLIICIVIRMCLSNDPAYMLVDCFIIVPFVYSILNIFNENTKLFKGICFIGKYSTFMWLTHTFFMYYIFPRFITISGISTIIFIQSLIVSLITGIVLSLIEKLFYKLFFIIKNNNKNVSNTNTIL